MNNFPLITNLIKNREYSQAIIELEKDPIGKKDSYLLSLLYRLHDKYNDEEKVVENALERDQDWKYMKERQQWHQLPIFDRVVPRPSLNEEPYCAPAQEILDNMCIVTCGSPEVMESMIQTIESVKAISHYNDIPYCLVQFHNHEFTDEQKDLLFKKYQINKIVLPEFGRYYHNPPLRIEEQDCWLQSNMIYPFIEKLFPEYRYIVFIESDVWVKNRSVLDKILYDLKSFEFVKLDYHSGFVGYRTHSEFLEIWQKYTRELFESGQWPDNLQPSQDPIKNTFYKMHDSRCQLQEPLQVIIYVYKNLLFVNERYNDDVNDVQITHCGLPFLSEDNTDLVDFSNRRITSFHHNEKHFDRRLAETYVKDFMKENFYLPVASISHFNGNIEKHIADSNNFLKTGSINVLPPEYNNWMPIQYRVWPWRDKPEIEDKLQEAVAK